MNPDGTVGREPGRGEKMRFGISKRSAMGFSASVGERQKPSSGSIIGSMEDSGYASGHGDNFRIPQLKLRELCSIVLIFDEEKSAPFWYLLRMGVWI